MRKPLLLLPLLLGCSLLRQAFLQSGPAVAQAIRSGVAEVKVDAILNAAGASIPVKAARTVELQRATGSAGP